MAFYVGQKVVCVDASNIDPLANKVMDRLIVEGAVYTVRGVTTPGFFDNENGLLLEEIKAAINPLYGEEYGWVSSRFRPIVERKTSIEVFKAMLNPSEQSVETV